MVKPVRADGRSWFWCIRGYVGGLKNTSVGREEGTLIRVLKIEIRGSPKTSAATGTDDAISTSQRYRLLHNEVAESWP